MLAMGTPAYAFAHRLLPARFFLNPSQLLGRLEGDAATALLGSLWEEAGGAPDGAPTVELGELAAGQMAIVRVVGASENNPGEAALVALVCRTGASGEAVGEYFTLEHSMDLGDGPATMLCERSPDGRHLNHGLGPEPEVASFTEAVESRIRARLT